LVAKGMQTRIWKKQGKLKIGQERAAKGW